MKYSFLDWIYPPKCVVCDNIIPLNYERWFCYNCKDIFTFIKEPTCKTCGNPQEDEVDICSMCAKQKFFFKQNTSLFIYEDIPKLLIYKFKYGKNAEIGKAMAKLMYNNINKDVFKHIDFIVPVPIHRARRRTRGFNQAEILCNELNKFNEIPNINDLLVRTKNTKPQSGLSFVERENNIKDAFKFNKKYDIKDKNILIVDDIFTTGRTLNECSKVLVNANARNVFGLNFCTVLEIEKQ